MSDKVIMDSIVNDKLGRANVKNVIAKLDNEFSLYDFIKKFTEDYESEYIEMLFVFKGKDTFKTVNTQIALFLTANKDLLNIEKTDRIESENIFRVVVEAEFWKKR